MKQLLIDHTPFHTAKLTLVESRNNPGGRMRIKGKLQESEVKNGNGRVYPKEVLEREAKKYEEGPIKTNTAIFKAWEYQILGARIFIEKLIY